MGALPPLPTRGHCKHGSLQRLVGSRELQKHLRVFGLWNLHGPPPPPLKGLPRGLPVGQSSGEVALDVGVHDGFEVLEFAVLEEVDDVHLETRGQPFQRKFNRDKLDFSASGSRQIRPIVRFALKRGACSRQLITPP